MPGFHTITSSFGPRKSPTSGASSNHSGIDISAPEGTILYSIIPGTVTFTGFKGANGHTIIIENNNLEIQYSHVSPNYIVNSGNYINIGEIIRNSWSKNISNWRKFFLYRFLWKFHKWFNNRNSSSFDNKKRRHSRRSFIIF